MLIISALAVTGVYGAIKYRSYKVKRAEQKLKSREEAYLTDLRNSLWWNIPKDKELIIDTSVWMEGSNAISHWFHMLSVWAPVCNWRISVLWQTYEEIQHKSSTFNGRLASRRIDALQSSLPKNFRILRSMIKAEHSAAKRYADPPTIRYVMAHPEAILFTCDRDMKIRAINTATHNGKSLDVRKVDSLVYFGAEDVDSWWARDRMFSDYIDTGLGNKLPPIIPALLVDVGIERDEKGNWMSDKFFLRELQLVHRMMEELTGIEYDKAPDAQQSQLLAEKLRPISERLQYPDMSSILERWSVTSDMIEGSQYL